MPCASRGFIPSPEAGLAGVVREVVPQWDDMLPLRQLLPNINDVHVPEVVGQVEID